MKRRIEWDIRCAREDRCLLGRVDFFLIGALTHGPTLLPRVASYKISSFRQTHNLHISRIVRFPVSVDLDLRPLPNHQLRNFSKMTMLQHFLFGSTFLISSFSKRLGNGNLYNLQNKINNLLIIKMKERGKTNPLTSCMTAQGGGTVP